MKKIDLSSLKKEDKAFVKMSNLAGTPFIVRYFQMQVCNQQEFDLFNQKCRHSSLSMGQEMKRIDSSSLKNEKTFQMSIFS